MSVSKNLADLIVRIRVLWFQRTYRIGAIIVVAFGTLFLGFQNCGQEMSAIVSEDINDETMPASKHQEKKGFC